MNDPDPVLIGGQDRRRFTPTASPRPTRTLNATEPRVRHDRVDKTGVVTPRHNGRLHHIGIGRTHARTHVVLLVADLDIRIINAATGELLRHLTLDPTCDYQPTGLAASAVESQRIGEVMGRDYNTSHMISRSSEGLPIIARATRSSRPRTSVVGETLPVS